MEVAAKVQNACIIVKMLYSLYNINSAKVKTDVEV